MTLNSLSPNSIGSLALHNDGSFVPECEEGYEWQLRVAFCLLRRNLWVYVPPLKIVSSFDQVKNFSDGGDIFVKAKGQTTKLVEAKSRRVDFGDDPDSYPYQTAIVDSEYAWKKKARKGEKPHAVILISRNTYSMLVVPVSAEKHFFIEEKPDRRRNDYTKAYVMVPKEHLRPFDDLVAWLHNPKEEGIDERRNEEQTDKSEKGKVGENLAFSFLRPGGSG